MANPNRVVGQAKVTVSGRLLDTDGSSSLEVGGPKRDPVSGDFQAGSFRQSTEPAKLDVNVLVKPGTRVTDFRDMDNETVLVEFDTGQVFLMRNAYCADVPSIASNDGKAKLSFMGPPAEELQ